MRHATLAIPEVDILGAVGIVRHEVRRAGDKGHVAPVAADRRVPTEGVRKGSRRIDAHHLDAGGLTIPQDDGPLQLKGHVAPIDVDKRTVADPAGLSVDIHTDELGRAGLPIPHEHIGRE